MKRTTREWVRKAENDFKADRSFCGVARISYRMRYASCASSVEKYLKARLTEAGIAFPRTHDLLQLLNLCVSVEPPWAAYDKVVDAMTDYAVDYRYPGHSATVREAKLALKHCRSFRAQVRHSLGRKP